MSNLSKAKQALKGHVEVFCNTNGCTNKAGYWMNIGELLHPQGTDQTFYLCDNCMNQISNDDANYSYLDAQTSRIEEIEIAHYSCNPNCKTCNP